MKNRKLSVVFSVQRTDYHPTQLDPEIRVGDQDIGSPGRPVSSGLQLPAETRHCRARRRHLWWPSRSAAFFLQNVLQLHQQRWEILRVDSLALWKIINEEDAVLIPKNRGENFPADFALGIFWGWVSRYASTPLIVALSPCHSDITRFRTWSPIATGNHLDRAEKFQICSDDWHSWRFWSVFRHFGTHLAESFRMSKSSWMMDLTRSREMSSCSAVYLAEIRRSSEISSWIWSLFCVVQDEAQHRLKNHHV